MSSLVRKLNEMGYTWPRLDNQHPRHPLLLAKRHGDLVYVSGQVPMRENGKVISGKVGDDVTEVDARFAAQLCAVWCLYAAGSAVPSQDILGVVEMTVYVNCAPGYTNTSAVANGASDFLLDVLGRDGAHARAAVGVSELPLNAAVEITMVVAVR